MKPSARNTTKHKRAIKAFVNAHPGDDLTARNRRQREALSMTPDALYARLRDELDTDWLYGAWRYSPRPRTG